jgi:hypothetical protein
MTTTFKSTTWLRLSPLTLSLTLSCPSPEPLRRMRTPVVVVSCLQTRKHTPTLPGRRSRSGVRGPEMTSVVSWLPTSGTCDNRIDDHKHRQNPSLFTRILCHDGVLMSGWFLTLFWTTGKFLICVVVTRGLVVLHIVTETTFASVRNFHFQFVPPLEFTQWTLVRHTTTINRGTHVYWICSLVWWNVQPKDFPQSHSFLPENVQGPPHVDLDLFLCPCLHVTSETSRPTPVHLVGGWSLVIQPTGRTTGPSPYSVGKPQGYIRRRCVS